MTIDMPQPRSMPLTQFRLIARFHALSIAGKLLVVGGAAIGLLLLIGFSLIIVQSNEVVRRISIHRALAIAAAESRRVERDLGNVEASVRGLASTISALRTSGLGNRAAAIAVIKPYAVSSPVAVGAWFMAEPQAYDGQDGAHAGELGSTVEGLFMPYWVHDGSAVVLDPGPAIEDYQEDYYRASRDSGKGAIVEPYIEDVEGNKIVMTSMTTPVVAGTRVIGVAGVDIALDDMSRRLAKQRPFGTGRIMLVSGSGKWIAHPDAKLRMQPYADVGTAELKQALVDGKPAVVRGVAVDNETMVRVIEPVRLEALGATWALIMDVPAATISAPSTRLAWQLVIGGILIVAAVLFCLLCAARTIIGRPMNALSLAVDRLADDERLEVPFTARADELGTLARAADVFRRATAERADADARAVGEQLRVAATIGEGLNALAEGDLTANIEAELSGAYGTLKSNFNDAVGRLREMVGSVSFSAGSLQAGARAIADSVEGLARRTESNAAALEQTSAALTKIDERVKATADVAATTTERTDEAIAAVRSGRALASKASVMMCRADESAIGIDRVVSGVDRIAYQTRVLAINASVEASRAGEAGKGFAVVAEAVGALAMRAEEEAKRARDQIVATQHDIAAAVEIVAHVDEALETINCNVDQVHGMVARIAAENEVQSAALTQLSAAVGAMDRSTQQNAAMVEETSAAAATLSGEAHALAAQAALFKTEQLPSRGRRRAA